MHKRIQPYTQAHTHTHIHIYIHICRTIWKWKLSGRLHVPFGRHWTFDDLFVCLIQNPNLFKLSQKTIIELTERFSLFSIQWELNWICYGRWYDNMVNNFQHRRLLKYNGVRRCVLLPVTDVNTRWFQQCQHSHFNIIWDGAWRESCIHAVGGEVRSINVYGEYGALLFSFFNK